MTPQNFNKEQEIGCWLESWPDGIIALDNSATILMLSDRATELSGWQSKHVEGTHIHDIFCVHTRNFEHAKADCIFNNIDPLTITSETQSGVWLCADGTNLSVDFRIIPITGSTHSKVVITFYSNRELIHNQAEMEKFAEYTDKNPTAMAEFDTDGQLLFGNPAMQDALLTFDFNDEGYPNFFPPNLISICNTNPAEIAELTLVEHEINGHWYSWHIHPIDSDGEITILGYAFDTTQQKLAEEDARLARSEARREFYAKMIHELRTPLNAVVGYSDVLLWRSASKLDERDQKALRTIKIAGMQLNEMISDTLDISKIEAGKMDVDPENFYISKLIKEFQEQMEYLAEAKKLVYSVCCNTNIEIWTDQRKVKQIFINLISNAIKYTKTGSVSVVVDGPTPPSYADSSIGDIVTISVSDTGIGIPPEQIDTLFEAYEQVRETKNRGIQGTGIGLALVNELTALLGGHIHVESIYGEGSKFIVEIPVLLPKPSGHE